MPNRSSDSTPFIIKAHCNMQPFHRPRPGHHLNLLHKFYVVGIRSRIVFHEQATTLDGSGLLHKQVKTFLSSSLRSSSNNNNKPSKMSYDDFTEKLPPSSNLHFHTSSSWEPSNLSKSVNKLPNKCSSQTKSFLCEVKFPLP